MVVCASIVIVCVTVCLYISALVCVQMRQFVFNRLETKIFNQLLDEASLMMKADHGQTNQLYDINWGALDHASRAPQLTSCNYYVCVCTCVCM